MFSDFHSKIYSDFMVEIRPENIKETSLYVKSFMKSLYEKIRHYLS